MAGRAGFRADRGAARTPRVAVRASPRHRARVKEREPVVSAAVWESSLFISFWVVVVGQRGGELGVAVCEELFGAELRGRDCFQLKALLSKIALSPHRNLG